VALAGTGSGIGLASMRERLAELDGRLEAGPNTSGGFVLCAYLPLTRTLTHAC
jgi:signal transduction histidine kinase